MKSKNTYATYIARSQLEFSAPTNTILAPRYTIVNDNAWLYWCDDEKFYEFNGNAVLNGVLNIDFSNGGTWYMSWVR